MPPAAASQPRKGAAGVCYQGGGASQKAGSTAHEGRGSASMGSAPSRCVKKNKK